MTSPPIQEQEKLLTTAEVAAVFGVASITPPRWARAGRVTLIRTPGGRFLFRESEIRALLAAGTQERTS